MSRRTIRNINAPYGKEFSDAFFSLVQRRGREEVWRDFITMSACAISNSVDKRFYDIREKMYMDTVKRYTKEEAEKMAEMFALVVMSLTEKPNQDFLGEAFSALGLHNEWKGQFFTPYHVGAFMAAVNIEPAVDQLKDKKLITVSDCCCGAGCLLIAFANEAMKAHIDFQSRVLFVAQDLDYVAGLMCYIQLSLLGVAAYIKVGNSLTEPMSTDDNGENYWFTVMYFSDVWAMRRLFHKI